MKHKLWLAVAILSWSAFCVLYGILIAEVIPQEPNLRLNLSRLCDIALTAAISCILFAPAMFDEVITRRAMRMKCDAKKRRRIHKRPTKRVIRNVQLANGRRR